MLNRKEILGFISPLLLIGYLFSGDFFLAGIPAFVIVWIVILLARYLCGNLLTHTEIITQASLFIVFFPSVLRLLFTAGEYDFWVIASILAVNIMPLLLIALEVKSAGTSLWLIMICCFFIGIVSWGSREGFIFGPNILYRIFCFIGFLFLVRVNLSYKIGEKISIYKVYLFVGAMSFSALSTGSRGGSIAAFIMLAYLLVLFSKRSTARYAIVILAAFFWIINNLSLVQQSLGRSVNFDLSGDSISIRITLYERVKAFLSEASTAELLFGVGSPNRFYPIEGLYPHNLFIEMIIYHGTYLILIFFIASLFAIFLSIKNITLRTLSVVFLPIYIGSMFSGQFIDHSYLVSFPFIVVILFFVVRRKRLFKAESFASKLR